MGDVISFFLFQPPCIPTPLPRSKYFWIKTSQKSVIPAFYIKHDQATQTILYSHGNAEDLGMIYDYLRDISRLLKVNIFSYDYTGYGMSIYKTILQGSKRVRPSEEHCYADIDAAFRHLTEVERVSPEKIILYGRSLGGGPSCYLAARTKREERSVGGLILHSAFSSVLRVVFDVGCTPVGDMFSNIDQINDIGCHVLMVHGTVDEVVPFLHGKALYDTIPNDCKTAPFWAEGMGHNNIEAEMPRPFIKRLDKFLKCLKKKDLERRRSSTPKTQQLICYNEPRDEEPIADLNTSMKDLKSTIWKADEDKYSVELRCRDSEKSKIYEEVKSFKTRFSSKISVDTSMSKIDNVDEDTAEEREASDMLMSVSEEHYGYSENVQEKLRLRRSSEHCSSTSPREESHEKVFHLLPLNI